MPPCPADAAGVIGTPTLSLPISQIFQYAATPASDSTFQSQVFGVTTYSDQKILQSRFAALHFLAFETKRWTRIKDFTLDGASKAQIAVTYLSPQLLEAVFQNHILAHSPKEVDVHEAIRNYLGQIYEREELIFLVTVFANSRISPRHTIDLAPREMILKNANDFDVGPLYDDHNLELPIDLADGPMFGFLYYPVAVMANGGCEEVLDRGSNTKINIQTREILIDSTSTGPYIWTIVYAPLVETGNSFYTPQYPDQALAIDPALFSPLPLPPAAKEDDEAFWRDFGRFIWGQITLEIF